MQSEQTLAIATGALLALRPLFRAGVPARSDVFIVAVCAAAGRPAGSVRTSAATGHPAARLIAGALGGAPRLHLSVLEHAAPRGLLLSLQLFMADGTSDRDVGAALRDAYAEVKAIRLYPPKGALTVSPDPLDHVDSDSCGIGWELDAESSRLVLSVALADELLSGTLPRLLENAA